MNETTITATASVLPARTSIMRIPITPPDSIGRPSPPTVGDREHRMTAHDQGTWIAAPAANAMVYINMLMIQPTLAQPTWTNRLTSNDRPRPDPLIWERSTLQSAQHDVTLGPRLSRMAPDCWAWAQESGQHAYSVEDIGVVDDRIRLLDLLPMSPVHPRPCILRK